MKDKPWWALVGGVATVALLIVGALIAGAAPPLERTAASPEPAAQAATCLCPTISDWPIFTEGGGPRVYLTIKSCAVDVVVPNAIDKTTIIANGVEHVVRVNVDSVVDDLEDKGVTLLNWTRYDGPQVYINAASFESIEGLYRQIAPGQYAQDRTRIVANGQTIVVATDAVDVTFAWYGALPPCPVGK
ncbi:MAG: hypothetical protein J5J06_05600 [Phycisphaerae bacterium]|nr:hypothetical protein [Phycisphaerae bacterium]